MARENLLRSRHFWACVAHLANLILLACMLFARDNGNGCDWDICLFYGRKTPTLPIDAVWCNNGRLCVWLVLVPACSVVAEAFMAFFGQSDEWIGSPVRWIEYVFSAGFMIMIIARLSGEASLLPLLMLWVVNALMQILGYRIEVEHLRGANEDTVKTITGVAWALFVATWAYVFTLFSLSVSHANESIPNTVYAIPAVLCFLFILFGVNQMLWLVGAYDSVTFLDLENPNDVCDFFYTVLSFVAKTVLMWMLYGGVIRERK